MGMGNDNLHSNNPRGNQVKKRFILIILVTLIISACASSESVKVDNLIKETINDYKIKASSNFEKYSSYSSSKYDVPYSIVGFDYLDLIVYRVDRDSEKYGLKTGDKIITFNKQQVNNDDELRSLIRSIPVDSEAIFRVQRNYSKLDIVLKTINGKPYWDSYLNILKYTKDGNWKSCIEEADNFLSDKGNDFIILTWKLDCLRCRDISSLLSTNQDEYASGFSADFALTIYEQIRAGIKEAPYKPGGVEKIRPSILTTIDLLYKKGYQAYANDLQRMLDEVSETNTKASTAKDNVITNSTGTGFTISEEGLIVTAHHVVKDASSIKIHLNTGSVVKATIYKSDPSNDIVILKIDLPTTNYLPIAPLRTAKTGERVFTIGFPLSSVLGQEAKYTEGVISALSGIAGAESFLQITVPVQPGNSGGPLVNENGYIVGIISSSAAILPFLANTGTIPQNINWAVKADYLRPLVDLPSDKAIKLNRDELIEKARRSVVLIEATNE